MQTKSEISPPKISAFQEKTAYLIRRFSACQTAEERYQLLMELGKTLPPILAAHKTEENLVSGCQSRLYLHAEQRQGKFFFTAQSDALISAGLAALLVYAYDEEILDTILTEPPTFLQILGIHASLSPNRSAGLSHIYLKMKQLALKNSLHRPPSEI